MRRMTAVLVAGALLALAAVQGGASAATVRRLAGATRYETAVAVSEAAFPGGAGAVIVASGETFPDALAAAPAAAAIGAPVLLVPKAGGLPAAVANELRRLTPAQIYLLGGTAAVSEATEASLGAIAPVTRIAGADRFETAAAISQRFFPDATDVFVADGYEFGDVLAVGAVAGALGAPILLQSADLASSAADEIRRLAPTTVYGAGLSSTPPLILEAVGGLASEYDLMEYDSPVALAVAATELGIARGALGTATAYLVTADKYPDALAAGGVAGMAGAPLLLASGPCPDGSLITAFERLAVGELVVVGGTGAVSDAVAQMTPCAPPTLPAPTTVEESVEQDLVARVNAERVARGIPALAPDPDLMDLAREWSREMGTTGRYEHRNLGSVYLDPRFADRIDNIGENIYLTGPFPDAAYRLHFGWMHSEGHRRNLLGPDWDIVGVGVFCASDGTMWATQNFASLEGGPRLTNPVPSEEPFVADALDGLACPVG